MKPILITAIALVATVFTAFLQAQENHEKCGYHQLMQEMKAENPQAFSDYAVFAQQVRAHAATDPILQKTIYAIPVVFHIVHEYGAENISDLQVYDQMAILNRDFRKLNPDISQLVAGYDTLAADAFFEFRLATVDPSGNCTNGIEHIYSHEANIGDNHSRINQWPRAKYVNIWVFRSMAEGIGGFATPPTLSDALFYTDGIGILHQYTGSTGTSSTATSRQLTHELGHFLGLLHPWGEGDVNQVCGDDGIADTPETKGFTFCPSGPANAAICNPPVVENYQNFMEMSFCQRMFTHDQAAFMRSVLDQPNAERNNLHTDDNLDETGVFTIPPPLCIPVADFVSLSNTLPTKFFCTGDEVKFRDVSWNAGVTNRMWHFEGGTPATSTAAEPVVTFSAEGWKKVTLVVSNASGADSLITLKSVYISASVAEKTGPYSEDFESGNTPLWLIDNPEGNHAQWQLSDTSGKDNSKCMKLGNFNDISGAPEFSDDYFYNFRLGGSRDVLISPSSYLANTSGSELVFDYAYATNAMAGSGESLKVYMSRNCGKNWILRKTLVMEELITAPTVVAGEFIATDNAQWKTCTIPMVFQPTDSKTRFKFEFTASDSSNNLYLDNIRVTGVLDLVENPLNTMEINVYPNPTHSAAGIYINYKANNAAVHFQLLDIQGKVLAAETNQSVNADVSHQLHLSNPLASGFYHLRISQGAFSVTKKVVVM